MAEAVAENTKETVDTMRIYEVGYTITPVVKEEDLEKSIGKIRSVIEKAGGSFIAEGAPSLLRLSYEMTAREGARRVEYDRGYFGWIKFEATKEASKELEEAVKHEAEVMRFIIFRTMREDTRAKIKPTALREVKRTETIAPKARTEETAAPISEEELDKALSEITRDQ